MRNDALRGYSASSGELIPRFEAISSALLYEPVIDLLPTQPSRIVDVGAGTGRDAAWLTAKGHDVTAVEPVDELRQAGMDLHGAMRIEWLNDRLPDLVSLRRRRAFDVVLLSAVWQHLADDERRVAMRSLASVAGSGGLVIMSLRHGSGAPNRQVYPVRSDDTLEMAAHESFELVRMRKAESVQVENRASGVRWTWLALRRT